MPAITVLRPREDVERLWDSSDFPATFADAPGDRGTEIRIQTTNSAKAKDALRRFKARLETGEVPRSDATPEGEAAERKLKQRPAQPLDDTELQKAGV